jgi:hypothetical protein
MGWDLREPITFQREELMGFASLYPSYEDYLTAPSAA